MHYKVSVFQGKWTKMLVTHPALDRFSSNQMLSRMIMSLPLTLLQHNGWKKLPLWTEFRFCTLVNEIKAHYLSKCWGQIYLRNVYLFNEDTIIWSKVTVNTFIMLQQIYISNKYKCYFELFIHQRIQKKMYPSFHKNIEQFSRVLIIKKTFEQIRILEWYSKGSCDTVNIQLYHHRNKLHFIKIENSYFKLYKDFTILLFYYILE